MARITEKLRINLDYCENIKNPFYVCWLNSLGGLDYWLFDVKQTVGFNVEDLVTFVPDIESIDVQKSVKSQLRKKSTPYIVCEAANLTTQEWVGLQSLAESLYVLWLKEDDGAGNYTWQEVIPEAGNQERINSSDSGHNFRIRFEMQQKFLPSN